jgi:hypothetical protein
MKHKNTREVFFRAFIDSLGYSKADFRGKLNN